MHLINRLFAVIIFSILISSFTSARKCCENGGIGDAKKCEDGSPINVSCVLNQLLLNPEWGANDSFYIDEDHYGEYLEAYLAKYIVREPHFCTGYYQPTISNQTLKVAVICPSNRKWYTDELKNSSIYKILSNLLNVASATTFLLTAAIYYFLPEVQDLQGTCYFHFTFLAGLAHTSVEYMKIAMNIDSLFDTCLIHLYLLSYLVLCAFMWTGVVCRTTWKYTTNIYAEDEAKMLKRYKMFAYGNPLILLSFCWIHVHLENVSEFKVVLDCATHLLSILQYYVSIPILLTLLVNFITFVHAQIKIWNSHAINLSDRKLSLKIIKYRLLMYAKLFFVMGIPWTVSIIVHQIDDSDLEFFEDVCNLLLYGEGIPIFIILVLLRKRVLRGIANRWCINVFPEKWKTMKDSETEEEVEQEQADESANTNNTQVRYNPQNDDEQDTSNPNSVTIITLFENPNALNIQG